MKGFALVLVCLGAVLGTAFMVFALYVRLSVDDPSRWHTDPATVTERSVHNSFLVAEDGDLSPPIFETSPLELAAQVQTVLMKEPKVRLLLDEGGIATYVQRTTLMGYPDYISVSAQQTEDGAVLNIYSRSRFGSSDFGMNEARVMDWIRKIRASFP